MLLTIRKKSQGWVAWLIVAIIAVPFALFGINSYFEGANQITIANVEGNKINAQTFENAMEQRRRFFRQQFGDSFDPALVDNSTFRRQVVEELVANQLIQSYAQDNGLTLSDEALSKQIINTPQFQTDSKFDQQAYRRQLSAGGYSVESYEIEQRLSGGITQIQTGLQDSALVNAMEVDQLLTLNLQQRDADYTVISAKDALESVEISESEQREAYSNNESAYQQPDQIKLNYLTLTLDDIIKTIELDDEEIMQSYEASKGRYIKPETRIASHILLAVPRSADQAKQDEVLAAAEDIAKRINAGEDFSKLAEEFSDDPGSKRKGGDLGVITKGQMVPEFETAVYSMKQDEVSEPIKTQFGYHIIKLTTLEAQSQKPLADVRTQVEADEKRRLAQIQFTETAETFRTIVFESADSLDEAAQTLGLEIKLSGWVTRSTGKDLFNNPRVRAAAFDTAVLDEDVNSEAIEASDDVLIAMHKNEFEALHTKPFDEVASDIETSLKNIKASEIAQQQGEALIEKLKAGTVNEALDFIALAKLKEKATGEVTRQVATEVFKQALNKDSKQTINGFVLNNGDYAIYRLSSITQGDPAKATQEQRDQIISQLQSRDSRNAFGLFSQSLRQNADVEIFSSLLEDDADISASY